MMSKSTLYKQAVRQIFIFKKGCPNCRPKYYFPIKGIDYVQYVGSTKNRVWFEVHLKTYAGNKTCLCFVRKKDLSSGIWENGQAVVAREKFDEWDRERLETLCDVFGI